MGLEAATYVSQLVATNPPGTDQKLQGDDHLRLIKAALQNTFPNADHAITFGGYEGKTEGLVSKNVDYNQATTDDGKLVYFDCSGGARVYNLLAVATAGVGMLVFVDRDGTVANDLTLDGSGAETINGAATLILKANESGILYSIGTAANEWRFFRTPLVRLLATNTFTAAQIIQLATSGIALTLQSDEATATAGPTDRLFRNRTGVANDFIGGRNYDGRNTTPADFTYAADLVQILTPTVGLEDSKRTYRARRAGANVDLLWDRGELRDSAQAQVGIAGSAAFSAFYAGGVGAAIKLLHVQDQKASGSNGGALSSGSDQIRVLNTSVTNELGITLASNQIQGLVAGTYYIEASAPAYAVDDHKIFLFNVTDAADSIIGTAERAGSNISTRSFLQGRFTIAATKTFEIRHRITTTNATDGGGRNAAFGKTNVFTDVRIWKVG